MDNSALLSTNRPCVSICVPVYNCEEYVVDALVSVSRQTVRNWEIVVVDDGSTDGTLEILELQTVVSAEKLLIKSIPNSGQYRARMEALAIASGEIVVFLDADDQLADPKAFEKILETFSRTGADAVFYNAQTELDGRTGSFVDYASLGLSGGEIFTVQEIGRAFALSDALNSMCLKAWRLSDTVSAGVSHPCLHMAEDRLQALEMLQGCKTVALLDAPLYYYRQNEMSITRRPFEMKHLLDQFYVEDLVDGFVDGFDVLPAERDIALLNHVVFSDAHWVFMSTGGKEERIDLYRRIAEEKHVARLLSSSALFEIRKNRQRVLRLLLQGKYDRVDNEFRLQKILKRLRSMFSEKGAQRG